MSDNDNGVTVRRDRNVIIKESLTVKSKRGSGTNDRDEVRKFVEREAEVDVPEGLLDDVEALIGKSEQARVVGEVAETMNRLRATNNGEE